MAVCFPYPSDRDDSGFAAESSDKPLDVLRIACENYRLMAKGCRHHNGVYHIRSSGFAQQPSCFMRHAFVKRNDHAARQEAPELGLLRRPADLGHHRCGNQWKNAKFQTGLLLSPRPPLISIGGDENGRVVDNLVHAGRRTVRDVRSCSRTLRRASFISSALRRPCCFSHKATAAKPARRRSASRAALVIQAEILTPSRAAAARMFS